MAKPKSRAQQFADLDEPAHKDFDPEEDVPEQDSDQSGSEDSADGLAGTEHYAPVGKSKLRKAEEVALGPEYAGSRISREQLNDDISDAFPEESGSEGEDGPFADPEDLDIDIDEEDGEIDSDEALGASDAEKFKDFTFRGSGKPKDANGSRRRPTAADYMSDSEDADVNGDLADEMDEDEGGIESEGDETDEDLLDTAEQHSEDSANEVFSTARQFPEDTDEDASADSDGDAEDQDMESTHSANEEEEDSESGDEDGKERRADLQADMEGDQKTFISVISQAAKADAEKGNALKTQRKAFDALLGVRMVLQKALVATNTMAATEEKDEEDAANQPYEAAEEAAIKLWNTLDNLRHDLSKAKISRKRKRGIDTSTPSFAIWDKMQKSEVSNIDNRQTILERWSARTRATSATALVNAKLSKKGPKHEQSLTSVLQDQLANSDHLIRKTKIPRSCAPAQRDLKITEDANIYDDGPFYQLLLKELVDQRRADSLATPAGGALPWTAVKEAKTKKNVDTKASKGRKMPYTVHEKLQNFMAPEDRCSWEPQAIDRFFGTLLGQKMGLAETVEDEGVVSDEEVGLRLFRSS